MTLEPFEHVVATHGRLVLRVCRALLGPADADDAWSETFIAAMRAYPDLRPDSNVAAWLATIAHRKAIDQIRKINRAPIPIEAVDERPSANAVSEPADGDLRRALEALGPKQRAAVIYHHVAGLPYADIGELLGSTEAAARRSAADGVANLRKLYLKDTKP